MTTLTFIVRDRLHTSGSTVCRRQVQTYKDGPYTERIKIFIVVVDTYHAYSNESESAN